MKCLVCETETSNPKYCSLSCANSAAWIDRPRKDKTKQCVECQQDFQYRELEQKFCSKSCSAKFNNRGKARNLHGVNGTRKARGPMVCSFCFSEYRSRSNASKYCSSVCSASARSQAVVDEWKKNPDSATREQGLSTAIRRYLIREANYQCTQCQWGEINPTTGKAPLEVDHIDGDCYNNRAENLRVLCPNCHSLTPTYKALNKSSRSYRKN